MYAVDGIGRHLYGRMKTEGQIGSPDIIIYGFGQSDHIQSFLTKKICGLLGAVTTEDHEAVIFYSSVYGGTENAAEILADALGDRKVRNIRMYDVSVTDVSYLVGEAFRADHLIFLSTTYNNDIFPAMEHLITDLKAHNLQNRKVALVENGSWAPVAGKKIMEYFSGMKNLTVMGSTITMKSTVKEAQRAQLEELADMIAASIDEADRM